MATVRPASDGEPQSAWAAARIPERTPRAVTGEGSPLPPRSTGSPVTQAVSAAMCSMSTTSVPTSSAVM